MDPVKNPSLTVFYNGKCPLCAAEIAHYQHLKEKSGAPVVFMEIHSDDGKSLLKRLDLTPDSAAKRLYAARGGTLLSGIDAFIALWRYLPYFKLLAVIAALPGIKQTLDLLYNKIAAPRLYAAHIKRQNNFS